jgi:hypothetical protein
VVIRLFSFLAGFLSRQKSYAMKQQPFSEKFGLGVDGLSAAKPDRSVHRVGHSE